MGGQEGGVAGVGEVGWVDCGGCRDGGCGDVACAAAEGVGEHGAHGEEVSRGIGGALLGWGEVHVALFEDQVGCAGGAGGGGDGAG